MLGQSAIDNRLEAYYQTYYGESKFDEWYANPAPNVWRFDRGRRTITLEYDPETGEVCEK